MLSLLLHLTEMSAQRRVLEVHPLLEVVLADKQLLAAVAVLAAEVVVLTLRVQETRLRLHLRKEITGV